MLTTAINLFFPPRCFGCGAYLLVAERDAGCCDACAHTVHRVFSPKCPCCALPREVRVGIDEVCGGCLRSSPPYDGVRAIWIYDGAVADAIRRAKASGDPATLFDLAASGEGVFAEITEDLRARRWTTPPIQARDLARRGWDPARAVARRLVRRHEIVLADPLAKVRRTTKQARLDRAGRAAALRGAFVAVDRVEGDWVVFDDVMTTGATLAEVSRALRRAGARSVVGVVLARSV